MKQIKRINLSTGIITEIDKNGRIQVYNKYEKPKKEMSRDIYLLPIVFFALLIGSMFTLIYTNNL